MPIPRALTKSGGRGLKPGEVGGLASGAELIEWAFRLCDLGTGAEAGALLLLFGEGVRVLVKVIATVKDSPAKYAL